MDTGNPCGHATEEDQGSCPQYGAGTETTASSSSVPRFCPNCGEGLAPGAQSCANCGAVMGRGIATPTSSAPRTGAEEPVAQRKARPTRALIGAVAAAVLLIAGVGVWALSGLSRSPDQQFLAAQREFLLDGGVEWLAQAASSYQELNKLSTDLIITAETDQSQINRVLKDSSIRLSLELDPEHAVASGQVNLMGSDILNAAAGYEDGVFTFALPELDDKRYSVDLSALAERQYGQADWLEPRMPQIPQVDLARLAGDYLEILLSAVNSDNVAVTDEKEVVLSDLGETLSGTTYVFTPGEGELEEMLLRLTDALEQDEELREFVRKVMGTALSDVQMAQGASLEETLDQSLLDLASEVRTYAAEIAHSLVISGFTWTTGISEGRVCLEKLTLGDQALVYESCGDAEKGERQDLLLASERGDEILRVQTGWSTESENYNGDLGLYADGYEILQLSFEDVDPDRRSALQSPYGAYHLTVNGGYSGGIDLTLNVKEGETGGTDHILSLDGAGVFLGGLFERLTVTVHSSDQASSAVMPRGETVDLTGYSADELSAFFASLGTALQENVLARLPLF